MATAASPGTTTTGTGVTAPAANTSTQSSLSEWAGPYVTSMLGQTNALVNSPYQAYQGDLTAGPSALQNQAFQGIAGLQTPQGMQTAQTGLGGVASKMQNLSYSPTTFQSAYTAPQAYQPSQFTSGIFDTSAAQQYMNPYLQASLNPQLDEARRQAAITTQGDNAKLAQAGAYGGSRQAIMNSEANRNLMTKMADITGQGYNTAYNNAMAQFNADQNRNMTAQQGTEASRQFGATQGANSAQQAAQFQQAANQNSEASRQFGSNLGLQGLTGAASAFANQGNLANQENGLQLQNLRQQLDAGATQRDIEQQGLTADYTQFAAERDNPQKMLEFMRNQLTGLPVATQTTQTQPESGLAGILSTIGLLGGIGNSASTPDWLKSILGGIGMGGSTATPGVAPPGTTNP